MRRVLSMILALLFILACGCAWAEPSAYDLALQMAQGISCMDGVREMPLKNGAQNRAIWTDTRIDLKCALVVHDDAEAALNAVVADSTRDTAVQNVGTCALYLSKELRTEEILEYRQALADVLGVEIMESEPEYILNVNTGKFHHPFCSSVGDIKESNRQEYSGSRDLLIQNGYKACKRCDP